MIECGLLKEQFMLGDAILVAPVLESGACQVKAYLPQIPSSWTCAWSQKVYDFGWNIVDAPIGRPGIFIKSTDMKRKSLVSFLVFCKSANR